MGAIFCGAQAGNQYGVEGSGLWLHLQTISDRVRARGEVLGHTVTALLPGIVVVLIGIVVQAVAHDDWAKVPAALGVCLGALFGALAAASYLSAAMPYAQPQSRKSLFASSVPGQKGRTFVASLGMIGGAILIALPAAIAAVLSLIVSPVWGWVALVLGPVVGAAGDRGGRPVDRQPVPGPGHRDLRRGQRGGPGLTEGRTRGTAKSPTRYRFGWGSSVVPVWCYRPPTPFGKGPEPGARRPWPVRRRARSPARCCAGTAGRLTKPSLLCPLLPSLLWPVPLRAGTVRERFVDGLLDPREGVGLRLGDLNGDVRDLPPTGWSTAPRLR